MNIKFRAYRPLDWDTTRGQPSIYLSDQNERPFSVPYVRGADIRGRTNKPAHLHARWPVNGFGEITLLTDLLPPVDTPYNLNLEMARARIHLLTGKNEEWSARGFVASKAYREGITEAQRLLKQAEDAPVEEVKARWADLSLSMSVPAGEQLALEYANWGIQKRQENKGFRGFRLGTFAVQNYDYTSEETRLFKDLLNLGSIPCDWGIVEKVKGEVDWHSMDVLIDWLFEKGIEVKAQPLFWLHKKYMPQWLDMHDMPEFRRLTRERILSIVGHYKDKIKLWDVTNELHFHNPYQDMDRAIELTRLCTEVVHEANPEAIRAVNTMDPFAEFLAKMKPGAADRGIDFLENLIRQGVEYEVAEVQVYHGAAWASCRDLFEMSRHFDQYERLGKPLILSELGCPSSEEPDPHDMYDIAEELVGHKKDERFLASEAGYWRGPWDEKRQADWVEGFCRVLMGKPFVEGIINFDFTDRLPHFYMHAGLLNNRGEAKEVYYRLLDLKKQCLDA